MKKSNRSPLRKAISITGRLVLVVVVGFVAYNLIKDARVEKVDQSSTPTVEEAREVIAGQDQELAEQELQDVQQAPLNKFLGDFTDSDDYEISGSVSIVEVDGKPFLKFSDDFMAQRGPDLVVYLSPNTKNQELGEFVSLGKLKERTGAQLYSLPGNYADFKSVNVWCRAFNGSFGAANLNF